MRSLVSYGNKICIFFILVLVVIPFGCTPGISVKKPEWVQAKNLIPYHYRGISSLYDDKKKALDDAFNDALKKFYEVELGIILENKTSIKKIERRDTFSIAYVSSTKSKTNAVVIKGVRRIDEYLEKEKDKYRAYVDISIPTDEVITAKKEAKKYKMSIESFLKDEFYKAEKFFKKEEYGRALPYYKTIKILHNEVPDVSPDIYAIADAKIKVIDESCNPVIKLIKLSSTKRYFQSIKLIRSITKEKIFYSNNTYFVDVGDRLRLNIEVRRPVYIYILSFWRDDGDVRLLFPNWAEEEEKHINGKIIFPEKSEFIAEPPPGLNYLFVIATTTPLNLQEFVNFKERESLIFSEKNLSDFLKLFDGRITYDVKRINVFIRGVK